MDSAITKKRVNTQWLIDRRSYYDYNPKGENIVRIDHFFDADSIAQNSKTNFQYDNDGNVTTETTLKWDQGSSSFVNSEKKESIFTRNNNLKTYTYSYWIDSLLDWGDSYRESYVYDTKNLLKSKTKLNFDARNNGWINYQRETYWYNSNQQLDSLELEVFNTSGNYWWRNSYTIYAYNSSDRLILSQEFRYLTSAISPSYRESFSYNGMNLLRERTQYSYNDSLLYWRVFDRETFNYDSNQNLIEHIYLRAISDVLTPQWIYKYQYDVSVPSNQIMIPIEYVKTNSKLLRRILQFWQFTTSTWGTIYSTDLYYSDALTTISLIPSTPFRLYPNPAHGEVFVYTGSISTYYLIYSEMGKVVKKGTLESTGRIDLSFISIGMYVLMIGNQRNILIVQ